MPTTPPPSSSEAPARWERVSEVFAEALEQSAAERGSFLDRACRDDTDLRTEVESLLAAHPDAVARFDTLAAATGPVLAALGPAGADVRPGEVLGHYRIEGPLGAGGMGAVYRALDTRLERPVALKFLHMDLADEAHTRLLREARAAASLDHPHICAVYGIEDAAERPFIVMACYEGETLRERLRRGPLAPGDALAVAEQIADGLAAAHAVGVIHRDLKPSNVMLTEGAQRPHIRLLDFGIAHLAHAERVTRTGVTPGTAGYMAPEQIRGEPTGPATDLWGLGVLLHEMLAGTRPFSGDTEAAILYAVLEHDPPSLTALDPPVPEPVATLVSRLLQKDPAARYPSAEAVREALQALRAGRRPSESDGRTARRAPRNERRLRRRVVLGGAAVLLALLAVGLMRSLLGPEPAPPVPMSVAVLPFAVRGGADVAYLREGLVDLLSAQFDSLGNLRSIDPNALLSRAGSDGVLTLERGQELAAHFGAMYFVLGRVTDTGGGLRLQASLYRADGSEAARAQADAETQDALLPALDRLTRQLAAAQLDDPDEHLASLAARTTASFPALRAYLDGERLLRAGRFDEAEAALLEAVAADTTFALAWYRLARAAGWTGHADLNRYATEQAVRYAAVLPARTRDVLAGYRAFRTGDPAEAERRYRSVLTRYPGDAETWLLLSEVLFHYNPYAGRPTAEALGPLTQALHYAPDDRELLVHLMDLAAQRRDAEALDSLSTRYVQAGPSELVPAYRALRPLMLGAPANRAAELERLREAGPAAVEQALVRVVPMFGDVEFAHAVAAMLAGFEGDGRQVEGQIHRALFAVAEGRWAEAEARFAEAQPRAPGWTLIHRVLAAAAPGSPAPSSALEPLRAEVEAWDPPEALHDGQHAGELGAVRRYLLALLDLRLGRTEAGLEAARALETAASTAGADTSSFPLVLAATLRSYAALRTGRPGAALQQLGAATLDLPFTQRRTSPLYSQHLARLLRAEALIVLGRPEEARRWYASLHDGYYNWGAPYLSQTSRRQATPQPP